MSDTDTSTTDASALWAPSAFFDSRARLHVDSHRRTLQEQTLDALLRIEELLIARAPNAPTYADDLLAAAKQSKGKRK